MSLKTLSKLIDLKIAHPPKWMLNNVQYLTLMGSQVYNCATDDSDKDVYGWCVPPKRYIFPHTEGYIHGFDKFQEFNQWQGHHLLLNNVEYDYSIYSIVRYFKLCLDNNPNMIDSLFVPLHAIIHSSEMAHHVRENRHIFLHRGIMRKLRGYAYSQLSKLDRKPEGKRAETVEKYGFDVKFASHLVRLLLQAEEVVSTGELNLDRNGRLLLAIKQGEWSEKRVREFFAIKEKALEEMITTSPLSTKPRYDEVKTLLIECLEIQYGSLDNLVKQDKTKSDYILSEIKRLVES